MPTRSSPITPTSNVDYDRCEDCAPTAPHRSSSPVTRSSRTFAAAITNSPPTSLPHCVSATRSTNSPKRSNPDLTRLRRRATAVDFRQRNSPPRRGMRSCTATSGACTAPGSSPVCAGPPGGGTRRSNSPRMICCSTWTPRVRRTGPSAARPPSACATAQVAERSSTSGISRWVRRW